MERLGPSLIFFSPSVWGRYCLGPLSIFPVCPFFKQRKSTLAPLFPTFLPLTLVSPARSFFPFPSSFHLLHPPLFLTKPLFILLKKTQVIDGSRKDSPTQHRTMAFMAESQFRGCRPLQTAFDVRALHKRLPQFSKICGMLQSSLLNASFY